MANIFDYIDSIKGKQKQTVDWFKTKINDVLNKTTIQSTDFIQEFIFKAKSNKHTMIRGRMFMFVYKPENPHDLEYYDKFPLVMVLSLHKDSILALNLHYLPYHKRAELFNFLKEIRDTPDLNAHTRSLVTYKLLKRYSKYHIYSKPCIKRYLFKSIKSRILEIPSNEWETAIYLPTSFFVGAKKEQVYNDSNKKIIGH